MTGPGTVSLAWGRCDRHPPLGDVLGFNTNDFDLVTLTLGFSDKRDGRQFEVDVPFETFTDVQISLEPLSKPAQSVHRLK